jgi:hypothetical protein
MELRTLIDDLKSGAVTFSAASAQLAIYSQVAKRERLLLDAINLSTRAGTWKKIQALNLAGNGTAIPVMADQEKIVCVEMGSELIDRGTCLDYSGVERNMDACKKCDHFSTTRKKLVKR